MWSEAPPARVVRRVSRLSGPIFLACSRFLRIAALLLALGVSAYGRKRLIIQRCDNVTWDSRYCWTHDYAQKRSFSNIMIVAIGCREPPGVFNPPTDRYQIVMQRCDNVTWDFEARESGPILRFARDYAGKVEADKIIVIHAHDTSIHYPFSIWKQIDRLIRTRYFWTHDFGNVVGIPPNEVVSMRFERDGGEVHADKGGDTPWVNATDMVDFLFAGTSLDHAYVKEPLWVAPQGSTFFMSPKLLMTRTRNEWDLILKRTQMLTTRPYCKWWDRNPCRSEQAKTYGQGYPHNINSYVLGELFERAWGMIFTGNGSLEYNNTLSDPDPWNP